MRKDSLEKLTVRIYDSTVIERMDNLWKDVEKLYKTKNGFIVDLLLRGIESVENEQSNISEMRADGNIFKELKRLTSLLNRFVDVGYEHYKESYVIGKENQILISRLYHVLFRIAKENGITKDSYDTGYFDDLPAGFVKVANTILEEYKNRGNS